MAICFGKVGPDGGQLIPYKQALSLIDQSAREAAQTMLLKDKRRRSSNQQSKDVRLPGRSRAVVTVQLLDAVGYLSAEAIYAPKSTPEHDTSAMDGFAICSGDTSLASQDDPVVIRVHGSVAAGDVQKLPPTSNPSDKICMEIMTGAQFPDLAHPSLDAVVKVEDVSVVEQWCDEQAAVGRYIQVTNPVKRRNHRRPAGSDFSKGDLIIEQDAMVAPKHIAALASLGIPRIAVYGVQEESAGIPVCENHAHDISIGILSTGSEIVAAGTADEARQGQQIEDSNGPYLVSALRALMPHARAEFLGIAADTEVCLSTHLENALRAEHDILITSGGVSKGRYDLVKQIIREKMGGDIVFHGVAVRPGAPVLFATHDRLESDGRRRRVAIFGAPGNPLAVATTLRFFVVPYLERLRTQAGITIAIAPSIAGSDIVEHGDETSMIARTDYFSHAPVRIKPKSMTVFWLASKQRDNERCVDILEDQASYKLKGLLLADCWVIAPDTRSEIRQGDILTSCPL